MTMKVNLRDFDLDGAKEKVYLALLQLGSAKAQEVAKKACVKRTTVYEYLAELEKMGLVRKVVKNGSRIYTAESPKKLKNILNRKLENLNNSLPSLMAIFNTEAEKPKINYYEGIGSLKTIFEEILDSSGKMYYYIGSNGKMVNILSYDYVKKFGEKRIKKGIWHKAIRIKDDELPMESWREPGEKYLREFRYAPKGMDCSSVIYIYNDKVAIASLVGEYYSVIIESKGLAETMLNIFNVLWGASEEFKKGKVL